MRNIQDEEPLDLILDGLSPGEKSSSSELQVGGVRRTTAALHNYTQWYNLSF